MKNSCRIHQRIIEGKTTSGDMKATAERLGRWYASHGGPKGETKAKPGEKGYMRPRNVPPIDPKHPGSKYDPKRHKPPVEGEPLEYQHPDHGSYARVYTASRIGKIAGRKGRWNQNAYEKGMSTLRKHGKDKFSL